jgi:hypothetical protein
MVNGHVAWLDVLNDKLEQRSLDNWEDPCTWEDLHRYVDENCNFVETRKVMHRLVDNVKTYVGHL